jgi:hypothetical protein
MVKGLQKGLVRNLIQPLDCLSLHIHLAGRSQDIDEPCTSKILRNEFTNQADLGQETGKLPGIPRMRCLPLIDKSA